jgi:hypothetical protein
LQRQIATEWHYLEKDDCIVNNYVNPTAKTYITAQYEGRVIFQSHARCSIFILYADTFVIMTLLGLRC